MSEISPAHINTKLALNRAIHDLEQIPLIFRLAARDANGDAEELRVTGLNGVQELKTAYGLAVKAIMQEAGVLRDAQHHTDSPQPDPYYDEKHDFRLSEAKAIEDRFHNGG